MRKQAFGNRQVSVIGLGSGEFGGKIPESQARGFMDAYAALGGNLIDTGRIYGDFVTPRNGESEKIIGRWLTDHHCLGYGPCGRAGSFPNAHCCLCWDGQDRRGCLHA